ncbi:DEAD-domain-containing protein [Morchella conica CCBAS932]|uniref:RNA helicase n=1 Tax=Morchella conica CCBAS932 TaxID=1392247 RepID=A0A3N4KPY2_9PEZI|nr:DEAD-domain-containing protein [Morchella conica CCBAS932]
MARSKPGPNGAYATPEPIKQLVDDFVMTISDSEEDIPDLDEDDDAITAEKALTKEPSSPEPEALSEKQKRGKKRKREKERIAAEEAQANENDGGLDSDFEFMAGDGGAGVGEYEGWGFEGAKSAMKDGKKGVDIDDIIRRRKGAEAVSKEDDEDADTEEEDDEEDEEEGEEEEASDDEDGVEFTGFDENDEDLAEDGFGAGADSEAEEDDDEGEKASKEKGSDDEEAPAGDDDSDAESVASAVPHPDDEDSDDDSDDGAAASDAESPEEAAKKAAFFAPEEEGEDMKQRTSANFQTMNLSRPILRGLANVGFTTPTLIQQKTIPVALLGKDVVGGAVTGSGKTAAFIVPILERLLFRPKKVPTSRVVILCPTRELAMQAHSVAVKLAAFTDIKFALAVGGLSLKVQEQELKQRPDVIIATPGRFIDHMRNSSGFSVESIEIVVMDEADRMLEDGFADELNEIINTIPKSRQTMLFSATMTDSVDKLIRLSLQRPVRIMVDTKHSTVKTLVQEFVRIRPQRDHLRLAMLVLLCKDYFHQRVIVFFRSKVFAHRARVVFGLFGLKAAELHGSLSQEQRVKAVEVFRDGKADFLLATDLASRGLDIKGVDVVINYEAPQSHEIYLHRVGRTARAGRQGRAITLAAEPDRKIVKAAVKAAQDQSVKVVSRVLDQTKVDELGKKIYELQEEIEEILKEEKQEKQMQSLEMQVRRGENLIKYEDEIKARPRRTWFETQQEKDARGKVSRAQLNGVELPEKKEKLSNKKRKRMEGREEQDEARAYKKTRADRGSKLKGKGKGKTLPGGASKGTKKFDNKMSKSKPKSRGKPKGRR